VPRNNNGHPSRARLRRALELPGGRLAWFAPLAAAGMLGLSTVSASAGTDGQQVALGVGCYANWVQIDGTNQHGWATEQWVETPAADPYNYCSQPPYYDWGWWWAGQTHMQGWWSYDGNQGSQPYNASNYCDVPAYQDYSDWTFCGVPS